MNRSVGAVTSVVLHGMACIAVFVLAQTSVAARPPVARSAPLTFTRALAIHELPEILPKTEHVRLEAPRLDVHPVAIAEVQRSEPHIEVPPAPLPRTIARVELARPLPIEPRRDPLPIEPV